MEIKDTASHLRNARRLIRVYAQTPDTETAATVADAFERCLNCPLKSLRLRCCIAREAKRWRALSHSNPADQADNQPATPSQLH